MRIGPLGPGWLYVSSGYFIRVFEPIALFRFVWKFFKLPVDPETWLLPACTFSSCPEQLKDDSGRMT